MTGVYRDHTIQVIKEPNEVYFIVRYPNGAKMMSGFFSLNESLAKWYQEIRSRVDLELAK